VPQPKIEEPADAGAGTAPAVKVRLFGWTIDRLHLHLALGVTLIVIGPLALGFWLFASHHFASSVARQQRAAEVQARLLEAALRHAMFELDADLITSVLREVTTDTQVRNAMILDHEGRIRFASDESQLDRVITKESSECRVCHAKDPADRGLWTLIQRDDQTLLRSVLPIENRVECQMCHGTKAKLNGMLVLDTSMAELQEELDRDAQMFVAGALLLALMLLGGMGVLVRRLILSRLARLSRTARSIAAGNLSERVRLRGKDVIASLATDLNDMADTVGRLVHEVRDQQSQMQDVMNSLDDGLVVLDADSRIIACNRSFGRRIGKLPETILGARCQDTCDDLLPCRASGTECPAATCRSTGQVQRVVFRSERADGQPGAVEEIYASPVRDGQGRVIRVVEIWRDITERVREEESLAEFERLVSLGALASGFSHEVNTPLATMLTCAESVLGRIDDAAGPHEASRMLPAIRQQAQVIREQVLRCRRITEQFLRFSRGIPPTVEPIDLREVVASVISIVAPTAREQGVELVQHTDGPLPTVRANSEVVQHVVLNLLINAVQSFEARKGKVELSFRSDDAVRLRISDQGCGIGPEQRGHLFEPFRSRKRGGTGLGLFLSRSFMRRFGGEVRLVDSQIGVGSCFEVVFAREGATPR